MLTAGPYARQFVFCRDLIREIFLFSRTENNYTVVKTRLQSINANKERLESTIAERSNENRLLIADINSWKPEFKCMTRKRDHIIG